VSFARVSFSGLENRKQGHHLLEMEREGKREKREKDRSFFFISHQKQ